NARRANAAASALAEGLRALPGARLLQAVEANELFVALPESVVSALESAGFGFYRWPVAGLASGVAIRLVTSYATEPEDTAAFLAAARAAAAEAA
ncbi:MAG: low specificity L-threonine aldolase, partial [Gammaproteobacteria bacterium]|nr:low specificity L-threonine aldolase [Gammaproteobacteria bacterium]